MDAKSKARINFQDERIATLSTSVKENFLSINTLESRLSRSEKDREELHNRMDRIDQTKASKELLDAFNGNLVQLRNEIDRRFDKLEKMLQK